MNRFLPSRVPELPLRVVLFCVSLCVVNAPFWLLQQRFFIERARVDVDMVLALVVFTRVRWLGLLLLLVFWLADGIVSQSLSYHFASPTSFLSSARFAGAIRVSEFLGMTSLSVALVFAVAAAVSWWLARFQRPELRIAITILLVLAAFDIANGSSRYSLGDKRILAANVAGSPTLTLFRQWRESVDRQSLADLGSGQSVTKVADLAGWAERHHDRSIWLVVVESLGWHEDKQLRDWVAAQLVDPVVKQRYAVTRLQLPFKGATTAGELRALCNLKGDYGSLDVKQGLNCLPAQLVARGWQTSAFHGFSGHMFNRQLWWPMIGLQQWYFHEDLDDSLAECGGAFKGVCDATLLQRSSEGLRQPHHFVYTLTLNTHLPLDHFDIPDDLRSLCERQSVDAPVCELSAGFGGVMRTIGSIAGKFDTPPPLIVVIGDHSPPFVDKRSRSQFDATTVPAYVLEPR